VTAVFLPDAEATHRAGRALAPLLMPGDAIGLVGDLGAGKTALVQGVVAGLGGAGATSPTFTLINEHRDGRLPIYHVDLYRIDRERDLDEIGLDEILRRGDGVALIEWADRFRVLPREHLWVTIAHDGSGRTLAIEGRGVRGAALAAAWAAALPA
jgi:tRNA threonylcarbamoyladenosine biosynthesis protein TsaE